jgi:hypothetical protein
MKYTFPKIARFGKKDLQAYSKVFSKSFFESFGQSAETKV